MCCHERTAFTWHRNLDAGITNPPVSHISERSSTTNTRSSYCEVAYCCGVAAPGRDRFREEDGSHRPDHGRTADGRGEGLQTPPQYNCRHTYAMRIPGRGRPGKSTAHQGGNQQGNLQRSARARARYRTCAGEPGSTRALSRRVDCTGMITFQYCVLSQALPGFIHIERLRIERSA